MYLCNSSAVYFLFSLCNQIWFKSNDVINLINVLLHVGMHDTVKRRWTLLSKILWFYCIINVFLIVTWYLSHVPDMYVICHWWLVNIIWWVMVDGSSSGRWSLLICLTCPPHRWPGDLVTVTVTARHGHALFILLSFRHTPTCQACPCPNAACRPNKLFLEALGNARNYLTFRWRKFVQFYVIWRWFLQFTERERWRLLRNCFYQSKTYN